MIQCAIWRLIYELPRLDQFFFFLYSHGNIGLPPTPLSALTAAARGSAAAAAAAAAAAGLTHPPTSMANHIRRRMAEKAPPLPMSNGLPYMFDRAGLDIAQGKNQFVKWLCQVRSVQVKIVLYKEPV